MLAFLYSKPMARSHVPYPTAVEMKIARLIKHFASILFASHLGFTLRQKYSAVSLSLGRHCACLEAHIIVGRSRARVAVPTFSALVDLIVVAHDVRLSSGDESR